MIQEINVTAIVITAIICITVYALYRAGMERERRSRNWRRQQAKEKREAERLDRTTGKEL